MCVYVPDYGVGSQLRSLEYLPGKTSGGPLPRSGRCFGGDDAQMFYNVQSRDALAKRHRPRATWRDDHGKRTASPHLDPSPVSNLPTPSPPRQRPSHPVLWI
uniref:Uncharacterized protein n=1 Tax=Bionectria ochroleuca TaxID=29856 RepID=A0A8H7NID5_BIOOC